MNVLSKGHNNKFLPVLSFWSYYWDVLRCDIADYVFEQYEVYVQWDVRCNTEIPQELEWGTSFPVLTAVAKQPCYWIEVIHLIAAFIRKTYEHKHIPQYINELLV